MIENKQLPKVSIVILNYNGKQWLEKFLPSVVMHTHYPASEIIIADNASTDDSLDFLKSNFPNLQIIVNASNTGYAGGYNEALQKIKSDYYVLLNSDVEVTPQWIEHVIHFMQQDQSMAACQPKLLSYNEKHKFEYAGAAGGFIDEYGYPFCRGRIFDTCEDDHGQYNQSGEVFWASGACLFIRADLFHKVGGFDTDFFAHMEEIDLCWRLKNLGYKIGYCAESTVYHVGGGTLSKTNPRKTYLNFKNNRALLHKNLEEDKLKVISFLRNILDSIAQFKSFLSGDREDAKAIARALSEYKLAIPDLDKKRAALQAMKNSIGIGTKNKKGIYPGSIVKDYFIFGKRLFSTLNFNG